MACLCGDVWSRVRQAQETNLKAPPHGINVGGVDAADCMRYLVATKSRAVIQGELRGCNT